MRGLLPYRAGLIGGALMLAVLAVGCAGQQAGQTGGAPSTPAGASIASPAAPAKASPTATVGVAVSKPVATAFAASAPPAKALFLEVDAPAEDTSVDSPALDVRGRTIREAVVSVNGDLAKVGRDGSFAIQIQLDEGANDVEVVASDPLGNETFVIRSVIYEP